MPDHGKPQAARRRGAALSGILFTGLTLLVVSCGDGDDPGAGGGGFERPPTPVETAPVSQQPVVDQFQGVGTIENDDVATLSILADIAGVAETNRAPFDVLLVADDATAEESFVRSASVGAGMAARRLVVNRRRRPPADRPD